ncbi:MAG: MtnX-like HAD-IB family phosphatase [Bacteroidetes bacterium]|nr:MtnX-like HAD-IB family phosphatase [Bacteroidota bacterium]MCW5895413.1 MtnX-like HAD-IB family phosphatase [Bacteroidota bacterium]
MLKIFVDFDGTITRHDVGNAFFREFGGEKCSGYVAEYKAEKISAKELFRKEVAAMGALDEQEAGEFLFRQPIDGSFKNFVEFCRARSIEFHVVSDGLDYYIRKILSYNGIEGISFFANNLAVVRKDGIAQLDISFPYDDAECTRCACCKRNIMLTHSGDEDIIVYIGEGYSDRCPVQYADFVFAKDELQKFCQEKNISYFLYNSFNDVVERMKDLLLRKKLRKRREAEMKRREAFIGE